MSFQRLQPGSVKETPGQRLLLFFPNPQIVKPNVAAPALSVAVPWRDAWLDRRR